MTNENILTKAINQAIEGGWTAGERYQVLSDKPQSMRLGRGYALPIPQVIIYDHDFAKALWGKGPNCAICGVEPGMQHPRPCPETIIWPHLWQYHLQQMVIAEDPFKYLGEHLG